MKKILIAGANSYIGMSFEQYILEHHSDEYTIDTVDMIDGDWRSRSFAGYDCVFHVAGIAHQKENKKNASLYFEVNRDLAIETARKAKHEGVSQFIYLSSMAVYGMESGVIDCDTQPNPKSCYGRSKFEAEQGISLLEDESFKVCILRPPMVYGKGCKGNFTKIQKIVNISPMFPDIRNRRSMIFIDNLTVFVEFCIAQTLTGVYCPQNREYVQTSSMALEISKNTNKRIRLSKVLGGVVYLLRPFSGTVRKAFGDLVYKDLEIFDYNYCIADFSDSIRKSI